MRKILLVVFAAITVSSCHTVKLIDAGKLNMVSDRNVDVKNHYELLQAYAGSSKQELKKSKAETLPDAVYETVKRVSGGEFLMNAHFYFIEHKKGKKSWTTFAVEGDVWGFK